MSLAMLGVEEGVRLRGAIANIVAALNAGAQVIFQVSNFAQMVGTKSYRVKRLWVQNNAAGNTWLHLGIGAAGAVVDTIGPLAIVNGVNGGWAEYEVPEVEHFADLMGYIDAIVAAGAVQVQAEVIEVG